MPGRTIDVAGQPVEVVTTGRHDPCVGLRATPIAEAMLAMVLMDHYLRHRAQNADVRRPRPISAGDADHTLDCRPSSAVAIAKDTYRLPLIQVLWRRQVMHCSSGRSRWQEWNVAVLGATGLVGDTMITVLEERDFPVNELFPLASNRSLGKTVKFNGDDYAGCSTWRPSTSRAPTSACSRPAAKYLGSTRPRRRRRAAS